MPTNPKLAGKQAAQVRVAKKKAPSQTAPKQGVFARIKAEAEADRGDEPVIEPYVIDDVEPPIIVGAPETSEQITALGEMLSNDGKFTTLDARRVLAAICGAGFPAMWELVRHEHISVLLALIKDMGEHFEKQGALLVDEDDSPGGTGASSS